MFADEPTPEIGLAARPGSSKGGDASPLQEFDSSQVPDAPEEQPNLRVTDIPECIGGRVYCFGISRGATVATARMAAGRGRCAASLWQLCGQENAWRVRTADDHLHEFRAESHAVCFFVTYLQSLSESGR